MFAAVAAGCDVNAYRRRWPELALMGGIDKRALAQGPDAIDAELDRVWPAVATGRYVPDLDHLVPDDVSWANYAYYCRQLRLRVVGTDWVAYAALPAAPVYASAYSRGLYSLLAILAMMLSFRLYPLG